MKENVIVGKAYIDQSGNIGIVRLKKDFYKRDIPNEMEIVYTDNINHIVKKSDNSLNLPLNLDGTIVKEASTKNLDLVRRFTLKDVLKLKLHRISLTNSMVLKSLNPTFITAYL